MNSSFHSVLAPDIESFIKMKRSLGYKYHNEEYILHRFDTYWKSENDPSDSVTMESLSGWVKQLPTEGKSSQYARIHTVKQFLLFRNSLGKPSYIPLDKIKCPRHPVIHILSKNEIQSLFAEIDSYRPARPSPETMRISQADTYYRAPEIGGSIHTAFRLEYKRAHDYDKKCQRAQRPDHQYFRRYGCTVGEVSAFHKNHNPWTGKMAFSGC